MQMEEMMEKLEQVREAHELLREYDGSTVTAVAEIWAEEWLGMVKESKGCSWFRWYAAERSNLAGEVEEG